MSEEGPVPTEWQRAGAELVRILQEQVTGARGELEAHTVALTDLSARLLIALSHGEHVRAQAIEHSILANVAMIGEIERSRVQHIFETTVWIAARLVKAALGVPA